MDGKLGEGGQREAYTRPAESDDIQFGELASLIMTLLHQFICAAELR